MRAAIRQILQGSGNTPSFDLPLKSSLVPVRAGNYTPTFTRSSTATVTDFEGLLKTAKSGEARFEGARRVENLLTFSEDLTSTDWVVNSGSKSGNTVTLTNVASSALARPSLAATIPNNVYRMRVKMYTLSGTMDVRLSRTDGTTWATASVSPTLTITTTPTVYSFLFTAVGAAQSDFLVGGEQKTPFAPTAGSFVIVETQLEDVTGQANLAPSEYVSSGVLSSPYHGAGVDGVKYFEYQNGNTVASNVVTENLGAAIPDATLKGYLAEGSRTNLCLQSETFDNASWVKTTTTVTADTIASPAGTATADTLTATAGNATILQAITSASAAHTFSIYLKRKTGTGNIDLTLDNGATWTTKAITTSFARYDITQTLANPTLGIRIVTSGDEVYAWGAQLE